MFHTHINTSIQHMSSRKRRRRVEFPITTRWETIRDTYGGYDPRVWNMFCYAYWHMRCGIFVEFTNGEVHTFMPFANPDYVNNWPPPRFEDGINSVEEFRQAAAAAFRESPERLLPYHRWWANGGLICNVMPRNIWGQGMLSELRAAMERAKRSVGDRCIFLNKRDHPYLRADGKESYGTIWGHQNVPSIFATGNAWLQHVHIDVPTEVTRDWLDTVFAPIYSFYTDKRYMDRHMPVVHDYTIMNAFHRVGGMWEPRQPEVPWKQRRSQAIFRGGATGQGVTSATNQRLKIVSMGRTEQLLDAEITSLNKRHKFGHDGVIRCINVNEMRWLGSRLRDHRVEMDQQQRWKWLVYASGHSGADRLSRQLVSGSLVVLVESDLPQPWIYYHFNKTTNCLPVRSLRKNLVRALEWARDHDASCQRKMERARQTTLDALETFIDTWYILS